MNEMMKIPASVICIGALLALLLHGAWAEDSQNATLNLTVNQSNSLDWNITPNGSQGEAPVIILGSGNRNAGTSPGSCSVVLRYQPEGRKRI
ncbi:MAG: hypothetical protein CG437_192 [Methanosaeta sp. NSP1]|nr:MAG: hypothetical protein CG437_192 [Methanosaeta sp. NSP1]